jgi:dihydroorotase
LSTEKELSLFTNMIPLEEKRITAEVCVHHLHFTSNDYLRLGNQIKCNPAIKAPENREALWEALLDNRLDLIATDHAPHTLQEKGFYRNSSGLLQSLSGEAGSYLHAHAGLPLVQHSLMLMLSYVQQKKISLEKLVEKMSHAVAVCFQIKERGFIREGYYADLVMINMNRESDVLDRNTLYKCGWSPLEGVRFPASVVNTFVNGHLIYGNGKFDESQRGRRLEFLR